MTETIEDAFLTDEEVKDAEDDSNNEKQRKYEDYAFSKPLKQAVRPLSGCAPSL